MNDSKSCSFAHGEEDKVKENCLNGKKCYNEDCTYEHGDNWNPYDNKKECKFCPRGFCNKKDKKFNHIKNVESPMNSDMPKTEDFPEIIKGNKNNCKKYSEVLKVEDDNNNNKEETIDIIKNMKENFETYNKKIKEYINTIENKYLKLILINDLNNIKEMINLFENNYKDIKING